MADSAPDPKLEDVLSSVRRLVSQELPKRPVQKSAPQGEGALVLTSDDRIKTDPKVRVETRSLEQRIAELEAAVDSTALEFEPDGSEDQAQHRPDRIVYTRPRSSEREAQQSRSTLRLSEIALIETETAQDTEDKEDAKVEFRHEARDREGAQEAPMAEDVPTLPAASAELHAFSDPDDVVARIEARIERGGAPLETQPAPDPASEDTASFEAELTEAVSASLSTTKAEEVEDDTANAADTLGADEAKGRERQPEDAPEAGADGIIAGPADVTRLAIPAVDTFEIADEAPSASAPQDPADEAAAAPAAAPRDPAPEEETAPAANAAETPEKTAEAALDAIPDEEAMRLLVGRLIRDELRGELGERITRNVRKLVRREMMRILESRSLD